MLKYKLLLCTIIVTKKLLLAKKFCDMFQTALDLSAKKGNDYANINIMINLNEIGILSRILA